MRGVFTSTYKGDLRTCQLNSMLVAMRNIIRSPMANSSNMDSLSNIISSNNINKVDILASLNSNLEVPVTNKVNNITIRMRSISEWRRNMGRNTDQKSYGS